MRVSCPPPPPPRRSGGELYAVGLFSVSILLFRLSHCFIVVSSALTRSEGGPSVCPSNQLSLLCPSVTHSRSVSDSMVNKITGPTTKAAFGSVGICKRKRGRRERPCNPSSALDRTRKGVEIVTTSHNFPTCLDFTNPNFYRRLHLPENASHAE